MSSVKLCKDINWRSSSPAAVRAMATIVSDQIDDEDEEGEEEQEDDEEMLMLALANGNETSKDDIAAIYLTGPIESQPVGRILRRCEYSGRVPGEQSLEDIIRGNVGYKTILRPKADFQDHIKVDFLWIFVFVYFFQLS